MIENDWRVNFGFIRIEFGVDFGIKKEWNVIFGFIQIGMTDWKGLKWIET